MEFDQLSGKIIGCAIEVHKILGPGLLESAYEGCLVYELTQSGVYVERQKPISVKYKNLVLDSGFRIDLIVENSVIIELKATENLAPVHEAQILTYMKFAQIKTGLLINFNVSLLKNGVKRFIR